MPVKLTYSVAEAAHMVGMHPQTYCKKLRQGQETGVLIVPGEWNGTRWIIKCPVFDKWIARQKGFNDDEMEDA